MARVSRKTTALSIFAILYPLCGQAQVSTAALASGTIGGFIEGLRSIVKQTEDSAHSLIDHGNTDLGQQQMVLAGIVSKLIEQLSTAYGAQLDKTFTEISSTERDTFSSLAQNIGNVDKLRSMTADNVKETIYKTQDTANQIIDRLPMGSHYPIYYGITVKDLTTDPSPNPVDIEVLGFHLTDPSLSYKSPKVLVAGIELPANFVSIQNDRLKIQLPDPVKEKVGFGNDPCTPRPTFPVDLIVFYGQRHGFWPITWTTEQSTKFNANAAAGEDLYDLKVSYSATRTTKPLVAHSFSARSGYTAMGCEQNTSASVRFDLPPGSQEISCSASWVDTSNVGTSSQNCIVGGTVATGTGSMRGRDKQCLKVPPFGPEICNCPGGGHGNLQISGSYKVVEPAIEKMSDIPLSSLTIIGQSDASATFPADDTLQFTIVDAKLFRKQCQHLKDEIIVNIPDMKHRTDATSQGGLFKAVVWNNQITVSKNK